MNFTIQSIPSFLSEAQLNLAIKALRNDENLSVRAAAKIYNVADRTLRRRLDGRPSRHDIIVTIVTMTVAIVTRKQG